jgi:hypothetical protein
MNSGKKEKQTVEKKETDNRKSEIGSKILEN